MAARRRRGARQRNPTGRAGPVEIEKGKTEGRRLLLYPAAVLSLLAALIHLSLASEHFEEWRGYGAFFLVAAIAQGAYGVSLPLWPRRPLLLLGVGGNLAIVVLYLVTLTVGVPVFGPRAGEIEEVGLLDLCATGSEVAIVLALGAVLLRDLSPERRRLVLLIVAIAVVSLAHLVHLLLREAPP